MIAACAPRPPCNMPVDRIVAGVGLAAGIPAAIGAERCVEYLGGGREPVDRLGGLAPKSHLDRVSSRRKFHDSAMPCASSREKPAVRDKTIQKAMPSRPFDLRFRPSGNIAFDQRKRAGFPALPLWIPRSAQAAFSSPASQVPMAARPFIVARWLKARWPAATFSDFPPHALSAEACKRAAIGEGELPRQRAHGVHRRQMRSRLFGGLAAGKEGNARHCMTAQWP